MTEPQRKGVEGRFNLLILILVLGFAINVISSMIFSNTGFEMASGSLSTGIYGLILLISLWRKPLFYYLTVNMQAGKDPVQRAQIAQQWQKDSRYRSFNYTLTAGWTVGLLLGSALYILLAYTSTPVQFQVTGLVVRWGTFAVLLLGTFLYIRLRSKGRAFKHYQHMGPQ